MQMDGTYSRIGCELSFLDSLPCLVGQICWFLGVGMRKRANLRGLDGMLREVVTMEGLAVPACAGGETPNFLPGLGLRKC